MTEKKKINHKLNEHHTSNPFVTNEIRNKVIGDGFRKIDKYRYAQFLRNNF